MNKWSLEFIVIWRCLFLSISWRHVVLLFSWHDYHKEQATDLNILNDFQSVIQYLNSLWKLLIINQFSLLQKETKITFPREYIYKTTCTWGLHNLGTLTLDYNTKEKMIILCWNRITLFKLKEYFWCSSNNLNSQKIRDKVPEANAIWLYLYKFLKMVYSISFPTWLFPVPSPRTKLSRSVWKHLSTVCVCWNANCL